MNPKEHTMEEMLAAEKALADYMFEHCYSYSILRPDRIADINQNENGTFTLTQGTYVKKEMICDLFTINDVPVFVDKASGTVYSEIVPDRHQLEMLANICDQAIALRAFQSGKEIVEYHDGVDPTLSKEELEKSIMDAAQSQMGPVQTSGIYGQEITKPEDIEFMWGHFGKRAVIETESNIFVHWDTHILKRYNELTRSPDGYVYRPTRLDLLFDSCSKNIFGQERTYEKQQEEFSKKLAKMFKDNPEDLKKMLAETCYQKGLQPILITGFDSTESRFSQEHYGDPIFIADPQISSMTTKQELTVGYRGLDFSESSCVAIDGDTLIAAICTKGPYTYSTEKTPKMFSSIDFSKELREIQRAHIGEVLRYWDVNFNDLQQNISAAEQGIQIAANISEKTSGDIEVDIKTPGDR